MNPTPETPDKPPRFDSFLRRAEKVAGSPGRVQSLLRQVTLKLAAGSGDRLVEFRDQIQLALGLVKDVASGRYREVETRSMALLLTSLLYFVVPLDVIPDFLLGWGLIDDAAVISYVFSLLGHELTHYKQWQQADNEQSEGAQ